MFWVIVSMPIGIIRTDHPVGVGIIWALTLESNDGILVGRLYPSTSFPIVMAIVKKAIAALNDAIEIRPPNDQTTFPTLHMPVGWAGTVVLEATDNDGADWVALGLTPVAGGAVILAAAAAGMWNGPPGAYQRVRARVSVAGAGGIVALNCSVY